MIHAFGEFVIGGNYAVGIVVFIILMIINFVVVTKGAGRISEVSARFTLDAMPGKQMAIDADLNAGLITQDEASVRRQEVREEADFYGAMDGASKFVRGDAIAGILILFINIFGGLAIGTLQHGLALADAGRTYTLLTIGDGLVAQIPALLLSTAVAIIVTRMSRPQDMGQQIVPSRCSASRRRSAVAGRHPRPDGPRARHAEPRVPGDGAPVGCRRLAAAASKRRRPPRRAATAAGGGRRPAPCRRNSASCPGTTSRRSISIGLEVGYRLMPLVDKHRAASCWAASRACARSFRRSSASWCQPVHIRDNLDLGPNATASPAGRAGRRGRGLPGSRARDQPGHASSARAGHRHQGSGVRDGRRVDRASRAASRRRPWATRSSTPSTVIATHLSSCCSRTRTSCSATRKSSTC